MLKWDLILNYFMLFGTGHSPSSRAMDLFFQMMIFKMLLVSWEVFIVDLYDPLSSWSYYFTVSSRAKAGPQ